MNRRFLLKRTAIIVGLAFNTLMVTYFYNIAPPTRTIPYERLSVPNITDTDTMHVEDITLVAL